MHITSLPQQLGWLGGKGVDLHPWGFKEQLSQMTWVVTRMLIEYSLPI
jgi:hypothetical protein